MSSVDVQADAASALVAPMATREQWLQAAVEWLRPWFASAGATIPAAVKVSIGFPSRGALGERARVMGQCFSVSASADGVNQIFISPLHEDAIAVADTLAHELVHAAVGCQDGHGCAFKRTALKVGLEGPMKSAKAGPRLNAALVVLVEELGPLPHAALSPLSPIKKQSTRMIKAECECGMVIRTTQKWIDERGLPQCACGSPFVAEVPKPA